MNNNGLSRDEVLNSRKEYGSNKIETQKNNKFLTLLLESLGDPIIKILLIALSIKIVFLFKPLFQPYPNMEVKKPFKN